ncbi:ATP-dependent zinc metalloprotease FtsH [Striga asiatica]|uniref:ATP-dependent zinc metalloprotease FtsH n=1 Tax=Striga asiatica TaxID=4170 RepID=A0A5A7R5X8_STRAF|nr:ATP-dependent zinc metalloprotease FtsH [Striga asiatica]
MACNCLIRSPSPPIVLLRRPRPKSIFPISCSLSANPENASVEEESKLKRAPLDLLKLSVTLTAVSSSLPKPSSAAPKVSKKRQSGKKTGVITPYELQKWWEGLPLVSHRLHYTEILDLMRENKLKHIVKSSDGKLKWRGAVVLVVFDDDRVFRAVLPSFESDPAFWEEWDELKIDGLCMNAYSPSVKRPDMPNPYLGFLNKFAKSIFSLVMGPPQSKKALELQRMREQIKKRRSDELERMKEERELVEMEMKMQKKLEEKQRRMELKQLNYQRSLRQAQRTSIMQSKMWEELAKNGFVTSGLGLFFFYLFYQTVVLKYKKQKKDYEDRLKIEQAEAEERKKTKELEKGVTGIKGDREEGAKGEGNPYVMMAKKFTMSGARVRGAKTKKLPQYLEKDVDVKFTDVAGLGKIRIELEEVVKFFTHGDIYRRRGVKIPGGILLSGPPGVGKTLLAKAVAGEAGVNFFSISASQFVEMYVGVGAARVRSLYEEAKQNAPSVVFIDELDAVGRERGLIKGSGGKERDATLNQLLVCLDGFEGKGEVITIASTNRPDILDPALVRPGRFDRKIWIPRPGLIGRIEILKVHARNKPMAPDVDYMVVSASTNGMVGAELANVIEVAAINMMRDGRKEITTDDLLQAAEMEENGPLERKERSPNMWRQIATNEAAILVAAVNFPELRNIEFVTLAPRARNDFGYARMKFDNLKFDTGMLSRQSVLDHITVLLAPRAADELINGKNRLSTISSAPSNGARSAARALVLGGLSEEHYGLNNFWTTEKIEHIDIEALKILHSCYERSKSIIQDNMDLLDAIARELAEKKTLTKEEFFNLVELHGSLQPPPRSIVDIRSEKLLELQNMMAHNEKAPVELNV